MTDRPADYPASVIPDYVRAVDGYPVDGAIITFGTTEVSPPLVWQMLLPTGSSDIRWRTTTDSVTWSPWTEGGGPVEPEPAPATYGVEYTLPSQITAPPSSGQVRFNKTPASTATAIFLHRVDIQGVDVAVPLSLTQASEFVYVTEKADSTRRLVYKLSAAPIARGTYWEFPVTLQSSAGTVGEGRVMVWLVRSSHPLVV